MERLWHAKLALHVLLMTACTYGERVQYKTADSQSHAERVEYKAADSAHSETHAVPAFVPGHAGLAGLASPPTALSKHRSPQIKGANAPRARNALLWNHFAPERAGPKMSLHADQPPATNPSHHGPQIEHMYKGIGLDPVQDLTSSTKNFKVVQHGHTVGIFPTDALVSTEDARELANRRLAEAPEGRSTGQSRKPQKAQVNVHDVLRAWFRDAAAKQTQALEGDDMKREMLMRSTKWIIKNIEEEVETKAADHVVALAFGEAAEGKIVAVASVRLEEKAVDTNKLVPVIYVSRLVAMPDAQKGVGGELLHSIVAWAKEEGRVVMMSPANGKLEEYYRSLGFQRLDESGTMVYRGNQEVHTPSRGLFLDLL